MTQFPTLLVFGAGKMGGAILSGALNASWPASAITVIEPYPSEGLIALGKQKGFALNRAAKTGPKARLVLLAIKPQMLDAAAATLAQWVDRESVLVSIIAGKTIADIAARIPEPVTIIRTMPNTPAAIGRGITGAFAGAHLKADDRAFVQSLLETTGKVVWLETETQIDAVTAVSGSGPAYVFHLVECLAKAGESLGLSPALAAQLARATIEGAGELLFQEQAISPETLRKNVTSPGGTTAAALEVLMAANGLAPLMEKAVQAAEARARALAG